MAPTPGREIAVLLKTSTVETGSEGQPELLCIDCESPLETHQPDAELPELILATCDHCKTWHLVDLEGPNGEATLVKLPDLDRIRGLLRS